MAALSLCLLAPLFVRCHEDGLEWSSPRVTGGDEPHYLVLLESLLEDGDLALEDDYAAVHAGSLHAGRAFAGTPLDHHTVWFEGDRRQRWPALFEVDPERWQKDANGTPVPKSRHPRWPAPTPEHEWSMHPAGQAIVLFPFLLPFAGSSLVEPAAIILSSVFVVAAAFLFRGLIAPWCSTALVADATTMIVFLGTPIWFYARTLFTEPLLLCFAVGAYALVLRRDADLVAGALLGLGTVVKPPFASLVLPLLAFRLGKSGDVRSCVPLLAPLLVAIVVLGALDQRMFGSPWRGPQEWQWGNPLEGVLGLLASVSHGLLWFSPAFLPALLGWSAILRRGAPGARVVLSGFLVYLLVMASWTDWAGGQSYGPRLIVPVVSFALAGTLAIVDPAFHVGRGARSAGLVVCGISVLINFLAAFGTSFDAHPLRRLFVSTSAG